MDLKYFILILFCGHLNNTFFSETEAIITEKQPQSTLFGSSTPYISANSQNTTGNPLGQPTQFNNVSSGQTIPTAKVTAGQPTPAAYASSGKPAAHTSAGQPIAYNITRQPTPTVNTSSQQTALPVLTSDRQLPPSAHTSTRQPPTSVYTSTQQPSSVQTASRQPVPLTVHHLSTQPRTNVKSSPRPTPGFILETTSKKKIPQETNSNSTAAILIGVILISMLVSIIMIVLWTFLRKPVIKDQNWAGRSPFADGETPDICMDNIRENEVSTKRTSIVSLSAWKPSKSTLLADDLEIKLFESSENIDDSNHLKTEKIKDQVNGTSEESADGSTIGTAVSSSDDADLPPPPPPFLDLEGQESNQCDKPTMTTVSPLPNDSTNLPPSPNCLSQVCEDHNSEFQQSFPPPPDSLNLPLALGDFMKNQEDSNNEIQCQEFSIPPDSDQDLNESLPPPPEELL
ncbi:protein EVI2B [Diceros bicornis minor]|uniref:protein EVI2B n=1 Tax=Diceros bicornis minor TaxID=77932 RepID=UPI0026EE7967|nr:protein EVI2B [Diceros bicornis minor]XP_058416295.1 protein EVI2B [Diceros bicornis minor]